MPQDAYPADSDVEALVTGSGVSVPSNFIFTGYASAAIAEFEKLTGYEPFFADGTDRTRKFDPPGATPNARAFAMQRGGERVLALQSGIVSVTSLTVSGKTCVLGTDYRLRPANADAKGRPWTWIEFMVPQWGQPDDVLVTGKWGYSLQVPDDAWQAIVRLAACRVAEDILQGIFASPTTQKEGNEVETQDSFRELGAAWQAFVDRTIAAYKLTTGALR